MVSVFTKAFLLTAVVFAAGLLVGIWLDSSRVQDLRDIFEKRDFTFNDARLQNLFYQTFSGDNEFCDAAARSNIDFSYKIYSDGLELEKVEKVNRFATQLIQEKKRYALLQLQFWLNSVYLKQKCGENYTTLLYFYSQYDESLASDQNVQSRVILDLINKCGSEKLLSAPLPIDLDVGMINLLKEKYGITKAPAILINEKVLLEGLQSKEDLEKLIEC
ncbi:MAG TPA: hypothetical protein VI933_05135 [archaeon]|nr:hypothetical protein [archaeon]